MDLFGLFSSDILGVRLASANNDPFQGPVEVFHSGSWRKVCGDSDWDLRDANVVCRELGFAGALVADKTTSSARGNGKIWMTCTGNEKSWTECRYSRWARYGLWFIACNYDAGVFCITGM